MKATAIASPLQKDWEGRFKEVALSNRVNRMGFLQIELWGRKAPFRNFSIRLFCLSVTVGADSHNEIQKVRRALEQEIGSGSALQI